MTQLPRVSGRDLVKVLERVGFRRKHQKGSHIVMRRESPFSQVVVPDHKELHKGTLRNILNRAGLGVGELRRLLER